MEVITGVIEEQKKTVNQMKRGDSIPGRLIRCSKCGYRFFLSDDNEAWYKEHNMEPPKKCFKCRQEAKAVGNEV
jgi:hypothetical protein